MSEITTTRPRNRKTIALIGRRFNHLLVIGLGAPRTVRARCDCGNTTAVTPARLKSGHTKSCGCRKGGYLHGFHGQRIHRIWRGMQARCDKPEDPSYRYYGDRGIRLCARWRIFESFVADMGEPPTLRHSIDRKDNDGNYSCGECPECLENGWLANCRWATPKQQSRNMRLNRSVTVGDETRLLCEWIEYYQSRGEASVHRIYRILGIPRVKDPAPRRTHAEATPRGEQNGNAKMTWEKVRAMRERYITESVSQYRLAKEYGLSKSTTRSILREATWKVQSGVVSDAPSVPTS